jgi:hypothetical protein
VPHIYSHDNDENFVGAIQEISSAAFYVTHTR